VSRPQFPPNLLADMRDVFRRLEALERSAGDGAWTAWTPTLTQSGAVAKTINYAKYMRVGRLIVAQADLRPTAAGTAGNNVLVGLPVAAEATAAATFLAVGGGHIYDASTNTVYTGDWVLSTATSVSMLLDQASASSWGLAPSIALASGDVIRFHVMYEAASS
jgi:hypothetical protein